MDGSGRRSVRREAALLRPTGVLDEREGSVLLRREGVSELNAHRVRACRVELAGLEPEETAASWALARWRSVLAGVPSGAGRAVSPNQSASAASSAIFSRPNRRARSLLAEVARSSHADALASSSSSGTEPPASTESPSKLALDHIANFARKPVVTTDEISSHIVHRQASPTRLPGSPNAISLEGSTHVVARPRWEHGVDARGTANRASVSGDRVRYARGPADVETCAVRWSRAPSGAAGSLAVVRPRGPVPRARAAGYLAVKVTPRRERPPASSRAHARTREGTRRPGNTPRLSGRC